MTKIVDEFKNRLTMALIMADMKPSELAKKTGISEATISQYRSGYSKPKDERLARIADVLGVDPSWLKGFDVPMNQNDITKNPLQNHMDYTVNTEVSYLLGIAHAMNDEGLKRLLAYAEDIQDKYRKDDEDEV